MKIGIPSETKTHEYRVAITPAGAHVLIEAGHQVLVQAGAGIHAGYPDSDYSAVGAAITPSAAEVWSAELIVKVKEPIESEYCFLRNDMVLFTYLHLAADRPLTESILKSGVTAIGYETVQQKSGALPLLVPMSEVAGRLAPLEGASHLRSTVGGRGVLLPGVPGTAKGKVTIIGGGTAGENAARVAVGLGAEVTVLDISLPRLKELESQFDGRIATRFSNSYEISHQIRESDLIIGAALIPGATAPKLVTDDMVRQAKPGTVFVDIAIDQGGCFEGSRPTTHTDPTFPVHDATFYCVANMPGAVPATSTPALTNTTLPYLRQLANQGWEDALASSKTLAHGLNATAGKLHNDHVAKAHDFEHA